MSSVTISGDTSGSIILQAPSVAGSTTLTLPTTSGTLSLTASPTFTGQATIPTINLTGGQITFPATQNPSSDANTLDDYEEGTWTPNVGGNATYFTVTGQYVKIGRLVVATFDMTINLLGTGSSNVISGLPFAGGGNSQGQAGSVGYFANLSASVYYIALRIDIGGSVINTAVTQGIQSTMTAGAAILGNSSRLIGTVTYQVS